MRWRQGGLGDCWCNKEETGETEGDDLCDDR